MSEQKIASEQQTVLIPADEIARHAANFTVGFGKLSVRDGVEHIVSAGSGTLATVGSTQGILTAAHVLDELPNEGEVAIILNAESPGQPRRIKIEMKNAHKLVIRASEFGMEGPDLGFLRISPDEAASLAAISSFYNLQKSVDDAPAPNSVDAVIGIVHERTRITESERGRSANFEALFCDGKSSEERDIDDYDLLDFVPANATEFELPSSFEGVSGGGLWKFYFEMKGGSPSIMEKRLVGVPFWQSSEGDGKRTIACHGPKSIYSKLVEAVKTKWPEQRDSQTQS